MNCEWLGQIQAKREDEKQPVIQLGNSKNSFKNLGGDKGESVHNVLSQSGRGRAVFSYVNLPPTPGEEGTEDGDNTKIPEDVSAV